MSENGPEPVYPFLLVKIKPAHAPENDRNSVMLLSEWLTRRSVIRLVLMGQGGDCDFGLLHKSIDHALLIYAKYGIGGGESQ